MANPITKPPIKLANNVPNGTFSKVVLNFNPKNQRDHAPNIEPNAIERSE